MFQRIQSIFSIKIKKLKITLVDTGEETQTGGRIKKVKKYLKIHFMTYGDGLSNVNINKLLHLQKK